MADEVVRGVAATSQRKREQTMNSCQEANAKLGLDLFARGEYDQARVLFDTLRTPIPPRVALSWAALLTREGKHDRAVQILSRRPETSQVQDADERPAALACGLFEDAILVVQQKRDLDSLRVKRKDRLLAAARFVLLPVRLLLTGIGRFASRLGFSNGRQLQRLARSIAQSCWVHGIPLRPHFMKAPRILSHMKGFERSHAVFRETFQEYLDYWIQENLRIEDLLLASVKPADAHALYSIVREKSPAVLLEIGTFVGFSTCLMARAVQDNDRGEIHCIDPNITHLNMDSPLRHAANLLKRLGLQRAVRMHEGFFSPPHIAGPVPAAVLGRDAAQMLPPVDFAFIDGDHSTWAVVQDFMMLLPCLSATATVVFHDTKSWLTVRQGIQFLFAGGMCENYEMDYREFAPCGLDGLGVIEVKRRR